jgi:alcohol dehydrogenase class IV
MPGFEFATADRIIFGAGTIQQVGALAKKMGQKTLIVLGRDESRAERLIVNLHSSGLITQVLQVESEPAVSEIQAGVNFARESQIDMVIGFGGGSALDAGKAIASLVTNPGEIYDYLEVVGAGAPLTEKPLPYIAIPTTAGTGSEVTRNAVLSVPDKQVKVSLRSPMMLPKIALIDPELTHSLPMNVTAYTGMDALTQLVEPYVSNRANQLIDLFCKEGIKLAATSLELACINGNDADARQDMALASLFGGLALANAKLGAVHGLAAVLGAMFQAPHGALCARLLPEVMQINIRVLSERAPASIYMDRYVSIARILISSQGAGVQDGVRWVKQLSERLVIPGLSVYGVKVALFPVIIEKAQQASSMKGNPVELTPEELAEILHLALT